MKGVLGVAAGTAVYPPFILILSPRLPCFFHPSEVWAALRPKFLSEDEWMMGAQGWGICMGSTCRQCPFLMCCFYPPLPSWTCTLLEGFRGGLPRRLPAPAPSPGCAWVSASGAQELPCLVCHAVAGCSSSPVPPLGGGRCVVSGAPLCSFHLPGSSHHAPSLCPRSLSVSASGSLDKSPCVFPVFLLSLS